MFSNRNIQVVYGAKRAALYDLDSNRIYAANKSGALIIEQLIKGLGIEEIAQEIAVRENTDKNTIRTYIDEFLVQLKTIGIIETGQTYFCRQNDLQQDSNHTFREVWLELTAKCNLRCLHCYASARQNDSENLPTNVWVNVLAQIRDLKSAHIQLTGGEPFSRKDFWEIADAATACGTTVEIFSNLNLCTEEDLARCKGRFSIATTLLGPTAELHDKLTQIPGSFDKTTGAIKQLVADEVPIRVAMIIMEQNNHYVDETLAFIHSLGVKQYGTDYMRLVGRGKDNSKYSIVKNTRRPRMSANHRDFAYNKNYNPCWGQKIAIKPDGTVTPCIFAREIVLGNILQSSLTSLIGSERLQNTWTSTLSKTEICRDCEFRYACDDCRPLAIYEGGGLFSKTPICKYDPYADETGVQNYPLKG